MAGGEGEGQGPVRVAVLHGVLNELPQQEGQPLLVGKNGVVGLLHFHPGLVLEEEILVLGQGLVDRGEEGDLLDEVVLLRVLAPGVEEGLLHVVVHGLQQGE